jgi:hypothetical protein
MIAGCQDKGAHSEQGNQEIADRSQIRHLEGGAYGIPESRALGRGECPVLCPGQLRRDHQGDSLVDLALPPQVPLPRPPYTSCSPPIVCETLAPKASKTAWWPGLELLKIIRPQHSHTERNWYRGIILL